MRSARHTLYRCIARMSACARLPAQSVECPYLHSMFPRAGSSYTSARSLGVPQNWRFVRTRSLAGPNRLPWQANRAYPMPAPADQDEGDARRTSPATFRKAIDRPVIGARGDRMPTSAQCCNQLEYCAASIDRGTRRPSTAVLESADRTAMAYALTPQRAQGGLSVQDRRSASQQGTITAVACATVSI